MTLISNDVGEIRFRHEAARPPPAIDGEGNQASDHDGHGRVGRQAPILASLHEEPGSQAVEGQGDGDTDGEGDDLSPGAPKHDLCFEGCGVSVDLHF